MSPQLGSLQIKREQLKHLESAEEKAYADLVALCQFLPVPASSQVGIGIGLAKAGLPSALAAWFAFTMPSALAQIAEPCDGGAV